MKMQFKQVMFCVLSGVIAFSACKKKDPKNTEETTIVPANYTNGIFITNEGPFTSGTGTVSFYNKADKTVSNDLFQTLNGYPLGNIVQSMSIFNNKGYIVVNNGNKIETVNMSDFKAAGAITGLTQPRYFLGITIGKAYVSEWGAGGVGGAVKVIDLASNKILTTINTATGAECMVAIDNTVFVSCNGGTNSKRDSVVSVINSITDKWVTNIVVGANPNSMVTDFNGRIWVLCGGEWNASYTALEKPAKLILINPATNNIEQSFTFTSLTNSPSSLTINAAKNKLYFVNGNKVYGQHISSTNLTGTAIINRGFYRITIDPSTDYLYASDPGNYTSNGWVLRYNSSAAVIDSFQVGVIPGNFVMN